MSTIVPTGTGNKELNDYILTLQPYQYGFCYNFNKFHFLTSAWGTGKSLALIIASMNESLEYPDNLGIIFRREYVDLRDSTLKDFEKYTKLKVNSQREAHTGNGSIILFRHIEEINNIQNLNLGWFGIEQGEELESDREFYMLFGRLRRQPASLRGYVISNAKGHNWIYKIKQNGIKDNSESPRLDVHYSATTFDNAVNLPKEFISTLHTLKIQKPNYYRRFVMNSDDEDTTIDIIIPYTYVEKSVNNKLRYVDETKRIVSCDPARYGDDKTVLYFIENNHVKKQEEYGQKSTMETCGHIVRFMEMNECKDCIVDSCGLGAGVVDRLKEMGKQVIDCNSASASKYPHKYKNLRAEMWDTARQKFVDDRVSIPDDKELHEELTQIRYKTIESNGRLGVESKEDIKSADRLGRSPDKADALVMGLWGIDQVDSVESYKDTYKSNSKHKPKYRFNSNTV